MLSFFQLEAQEKKEELTCLQFRHVDENIALDTLYLDPSTLFITNRYGDTLAYSFDTRTRILQLEKKPDNEPIRICFREVFPEVVLPARYSAQSDSDRVAPPAFSLPVLQREELFTTDGIQKTGVLSRGISFGNTQNVFVNSVLNLQMEGQLSENLNLRASITDQQVPFQPEGNTLQLRQFDRVFIELYNDKGSITAGDVVFSNPESQFLRYYKNVQGARLDLQSGLKETGKSYAGVSLAKGRFVSSVVEPIEGVSGPYRLRGPDNERFVVVMANSERVYVDGKLMQRGFDFDYVIDYNLAEITFTAKVLITQFTRIRVDFEFADRNFARSILALGHEQEVGKFTFSAHAYSEKDNENRPLLTELSQADLQSIADAGNDPSLAVRPGFSQEPFNSNSIQYVQKDTLLANGEVYRVFVRATSSTEPVFRVVFTELGPGRGNYQQSGSTENGRVFEWVAPQNGQPSGSFDPVLRLPVPNKKEMLTAGVAYASEKGDRLFLEGALSELNNNLLSEAGAAREVGQALKLGYQSADQKLQLWKPYQYRHFADFEWNSKEFNFIDRLRYIEFDRDWGLEVGTPPAQGREQILNTGLELRADDGAALSLSLSGRKRGEVVNGWQQKFSLSEKIAGFNLQSQGFLMRNKNPSYEASWNQWAADLRYEKLPLQPGYRFESDRNVVRRVDTDSVLRTAMNFSEHRVYVQTSDTSRWQLNLSQTWRVDRLPFAGALMDGTYARNTSMSTRTSGKGQSLSLLLTYRQLENLLPDSQGRIDETLLGRAEWMSNLWQGAVRSELTYQVGDSRELQREFVFLQVPTGEGTHTWRDDNQDGLQDLNEFYEAINPDEKNFIKVFTPTDTYIRAFDQILNYRLSLNTPTRWRNRAGFMGLLSKFSFIGSYALDKKITDNSLSARLLPEIGSIADEDLLSYRRSSRATLFFNRSTKGFGAEWALVQTDRRQLLTRGFEGQSQYQNLVNFRYTFSNRLNALVRVQQGQRSASSDFLSQRNFEIDNRALQPELIWQPNLQTRFSGSYQWAYRESGAGEPADSWSRQHEAVFDFRYTKVNATTLAARVRYIGIAFEGVENSPLGYELLQALRPGNNFTWSTDLTQRLFNGLQLTLSYEGRKSQERRVVHTGRMQISALF